MKKQLLYCSFFTIFFFSINWQLKAQAPAWVSNATYGSSVNENARASCIDASGNVYYTGTYSGSFSFGSFTLPAPVGVSDVFIVKFNSSGVSQWVNYIGSSSTDQIGGIVADAGGVYVVGNFSTTCTFGGTISKAVVGSTDAYVAKLNPSTGAFLWANTFGCSSGDVGSAICLDGSDGVYATGTFAGTAASTIASGPSSTIPITPTSVSSADIFVARFNRATGYCSWFSQPASSSSGEVGKGICYTKQNLVAVGNYSGNAVLGGITLPTPSGSDVFIARLDTLTGTWLSVQTAGATLTGGTDVAVGCDYDTTTKATYITGYFGNGSASSGGATSITFGSTTLTTAGGVNIDDIFVLRYDHINNTFKWARNYGSAGFERPQGLSFDNYGGVYIFASDQSTSVTIGSTTLVNGAPSPSVKQVPLIFKITANDGTPLWAVDGVVSAGTSFSNTPYGVVAYNSGATRNIFINGHYSTSLQFGSLATINVAGGSSGDVFLAKLTDNNTCFTNINIEGNSQTIVDEDITASATDHTDFGSIAIGSTVVRTFTIRNSGSSTLNISSIGISGANASLFTQGGLTLPATVAGGATKTFTITYTPVAAGTHAAIITVNSNDCAEGTYSYSTKGVATSAAPLSATQSQTNLACNAICSGSATVVASGGVSPYTYNWSPSGGSGATASSLCNGSYTCTITDNVGTPIIKSFTITQPSVLTSSVVISNAACANINNGSATVSAGGGTPSYSYAWSPSGGTSVAAINLAAGNYTITITDGSGCIGTQAVTIGVNSATQTGGVAGTAGGGPVSQTQTVATASGTYTDGSCNYITTVQASGLTPVSGNVTTKVWIENTVPVTGGSPYVARHYEITPAINPATSTGTVKLYFLQSEFDAFNAAAGSILNLPTGPSDAAGIANLRVGKYSGTSSDNTGTPASYSSSTLVINPVDANIIWNATAGRWEVSFDVSGFSGFIVQTGSFTLPVSWVSFTAAKLDEKVLLKWQTATETNSSNFIIEHSADGTSFTAIGIVTAAGNSNSLHNYSFIHNAPLRQNNFYRIIQTDNDGRKNYSDIRKISFDTKGDGFMILVNPVLDGKLQVQFNNSADAVIYNSTGQIVKKEFIAAGSQTINLSGLPAGTYVLQAGGETKKFIIK
jgi:hypothetical protein